MKILYIHNDYYKPSGEEHAAEALVTLLQERNNEVNWYRRSSTELDNIFLGRLRSPFLSIHNPKAIRSVKRIIHEHRPDVVQVQNLYPLISPGILKVIMNEGIPLVMRCPNYRLFCPNGLFYNSKENICESCTSKGHELWCIRLNCMGSRSKSIAYAIRNFIARKANVFKEYVDIFIVQSEFQKKKFVELGIPEGKIAILPGIAPEPTSDDHEINPGKLVSFIGRVSSEKGINDFLGAAAIMSETRFAVAGSIPEGTTFKYSPPNVEWRGFLKKKDLDKLYSESSVIVVPSRWYEGFPNVITRAMMHSRPVITTDIGCFPDIIDHGVNGYMYPPGDIDSLVSHIKWIIQNPTGAATMGRNGREKADKQYSGEVIYSKLMEIYSKALEIHKVDNRR